MKRKDKRRTKHNVSATNSPLQELSALMHKYGALIWFSTDEAWGMHDIDTHYYHVKLNGEPEFTAPCRFFRVHHDGFAFWEWCNKYISEVDTEMSYFSHVGAKAPTGKTAEFLTQIASFMEKHNAYMEPNQIVINGSHFALKGPGITAESFAAAQSFCEHKYEFYKKGSSGLCSDARTVWEEYKCAYCGDIMRKHEHVEVTE